jgi:hypothetical protein
MQTFGSELIYLKGKVKNLFPTILESNIMALEAVLEFQLYNAGRFCGM